MRSRKFRVVVTQEVVVTVNDPSVIRRCVDDEDDWRGTYYPLSTEEDVIGHLAMNADSMAVNRLDGWADLDSQAATMYIESAEVESVDEIWEGAAP